jgi:hypothetical protein
LGLIRLCDFALGDEKLPFLKARPLKGNRSETEQLQRKGHEKLAKQKISQIGNSFKTLAIRCTSAVG